MPQIKVTLTETIEVPEGVDIQTAETGIHTGFALPGVGFFKPWVTLERFPGNDDKDDPVGDMTHSASQDFGIEQCVEFDRTIEIVGDEPSVQSVAPAKVAVCGPLSWKASKPEVRSCTAKAVARTAIAGIKGNIDDDLAHEVLDAYGDQIVSAVLDTLGIDPLSRAA